MFLRLPSLLQLAQVVADKWSAVQVELHGQYSLDRMRAFHEYWTCTNWLRILFCCVVTPIPCLVINIALDVAPLAKPSAGRDANYVFWARSSIFATITSFWIFMQLGFLVPTLGMTRSRALSISAVATLSCVGLGYVVAGFVPMPIPFWLLTVTPMFIISTTPIITIYFGCRLRTDTDLRSATIRATSVIALQLCQTFIYPIFIYGFNSVPTAYQIPYMVLLPAVKIVTKNIMSKLVGSNDDMKPEVVVFNIDCFNAVYVSLAMQRATTISTSFTVMFIDIAQGCVSVYDVYQAYQPLKKYMTGINNNSPLRGKNFLEVAIALTQNNFLGRGDEAIRSSKGRTKSSRSNHQSPSSKPMRCDNTVAKMGNKVAPFRFSSTIKVRSSLTRKQNEVSSAENRAAFLLASRKLLFTTEFVILIEYAEVIMPVFYSLYTTAIFFLPNRVFHATVAHIDEQQLWAMVTSVLVYAALELLSLIAMNFILYRITGVSAMRQVGFILESQSVMIQSKLLSWVLYAVENNLEHLGADYSFQFKWLRSS